MSNHEMKEGRDHKRGRKKGWGVAFGVEQDLRLLPPVLFRLCLTLAAAQSNMPLC